MLHTADGIPYILYGIRHIVVDHIRHIDKMIYGKHQVDQFYIDAKTFPLAKYSPIDSCKVRWYKAYAGPYTVHRMNKPI